jgi:D-alanyl-lipoteichoic acid acyltransferase DltB (MBOAT superfamily)
MPQFANLRNKYINWENIYTGLFFLGIGLFKKVAVAGTFAAWVNEGFSNPDNLTFLTAWKTSLSYTMQLYFDFSGYTDMAIGSAYFFNIKIPQNFDSPYISLNIQEFWRRWHITLGRFLRDYIYIPLGGNRKGQARTYTNLFLTFLIGGIWHGAGWTFILWGALHGLALCCHRLWTNMGLRMPKIAAWLVTFLFVNAAWVIFRADSFQTAFDILRTMTDLSSIDLQLFVHAHLQKIEVPALAGLIIVFIYVLQDIFYKNTQSWASQLRANARWTIGTATAFVTGILLMMNLNRFTEFIYFQF